MGFYLGIDLGTSYFKAGIFDEDGNLRGLGRRIVKKETGDGSICELLVPVFWDTLYTCIGEALQEAGINPEKIKAISYSSQANSFVLLDNLDNPLTHLILWPDKRAEEFDRLIERFSSKNEFLEKTGLGIEPNAEFSISKINWFQKKQPKIWEGVKSILSISDYMTFGFTGQKISDVSTASMTGLLDVTQCRWWNKSLKLLSLSPDLLPVPKRIGHFAGLLTKSGAKRIGLAEGIPFYLGGLDHHCAAIGSGIIQRNNISESTGTVLACVEYSSEFSTKDQLCLAPGLASGHYFRMVFDENGALALDWYRKKFAPESGIPELLEMAKKVETGSEGLVAKPCANKYPGLTGFENVRPNHRHGHFVRAILESTTESLDKLIRILNGNFSGQVVSTGGGARSNFWVQIKANKLQTVFNIPECNETACLGAAMIGAQSFGKVHNLDLLINKWVRYKEVIIPL